MALPLPPHPDLPAWAERHGLDASRVVAPLDVRPAPTREHPHQVRVDYVVLLTDSSGRVHRDARTMLTCDPPPPLNVAAPKGCTCAVPCDTAHVCAEVPHAVWLDDDEIRAAAGRYLDTHPTEKAELDRLARSARINTTEVRRMARHHANEHRRRNEPPGAVLTGTVPGLCDEVDRLRATVSRFERLVRQGRTFGVAAFTYETLVATLAGPTATGAVPVGYVAGVEAPTWRPSAKVEQCNACGSRRRGERDDLRTRVRGRDVLVTCTASWHDEPVPQRVTVWCAPCAGPRDVVETFDDQVGVEEQARDVRVRSLDCGHDEVTPIRRATGRCPHVDAPDACDCAPVIP